MKRLSPTGSQPRVGAQAADGSDHWPLGAVFVVVFTALLIAYFPSLRGEFLWDDAGHVTNPELQSWTGLHRIWFEPGVTQQYYPLLHSAFWVEHRIWGDATIGYRLINVFWHAVSACLLVVVLRRLAVSGALLAGFLFALHPVCVESVAWISEQKNTLSTLLYLAAALAWLRFEDERRPARYAIALVLFLAALLTKTVTATLPAALLVVAWWRRGRLSWRGDVLPLLPWFVAGAAAGLFTVWFERTGIGAQGTDFDLGLVERGLLAGRVFWFYLGKLVWPSDLTFFYPRWQVDASVVWQYLFPAAGLTLLGSLVWLARQGRGRGPLAAFLIFGGTLFPVLGFVNVYPFVFSYVADHFQYLASLSLFTLAAAGLVGAARDARLRLSWRAAKAIGFGLLVLLGTLTWRQSGMYRDVFTLYETTLERNPSSWAAHLNLGTALANAGHPAESLSHLRRANELKPDFPEALNSLGDTLNRLGRSREALPLLERALQIQPRFAEAHNTRGVALMALGRAEEGIAEFRRSLELNPRLASVRVNLGWALANQGRAAEAIAQFEEARLLQPGFADAEFKWGLTIAMNGRLTEAIPHLQRAIELQPEDPEMRYVLGSALLEIGRRAEAIEHFEETLRLNPNHTGARASLGQLLRASSATP